MTTKTKELKFTESWDHNVHENWAAGELSLNGDLASATILLGFREVTESETGESIAYVMITLIIACFSWPAIVISFLVNPDGWRD